MIKGDKVVACLSSDSAHQETHFNHARMLWVAECCSRGREAKRSTYGGQRYHSGAELRCRSSQESWFQQLEKQEMAQMVCAKLGLKAICCLSLRCGHDTCIGDLG